MAALNKSALKQLLKKEEQGNLTANERQILDEWYNEFDENEKNLVVFRDAAHENEVKQRLLNSILVSYSTTYTLPTAGKYKRMVAWFSVAAALLAIVGGAFLWRNIDERFFRKETLVSCETGQGMLKQIQLEDGTSIWLNAGSKLRYPLHFNKQLREVYLEGEAYFDVVHNPSKPFIVHTNRLTTTVLGTAFSVTAYKEMQVQAVVVNRGKVRVADGNRALGFLTPNKRVQFNLNTGKSLFTEVDAASFMSWKDGKLQFEDQDMRDIAARLGRWYGYNFKFEHEQIKNCRYTASFNNKIQLNKLLTVMKAISLVNYKIDDSRKTVTFLGTGCNN